MASRHGKHRTYASTPDLSRSSHSSTSPPSPGVLEPPTSTTSQKKRSRLLSGLHPSQDVIGGMPLPWEGQDSTSPDLPPPSTRYTTRGTLNGFQQGIYDNKYHPMDKFLRPRASAKRERRLKVQSTPTAVDAETEQSDGEHDCMVPSSGSGSDVEDADANADSEESPIHPSRKSAPTRRSQRDRRPGSAAKPIYNAKKHPMDDMLEDSDHRPRRTKKLNLPRSTGTNHADTPEGVNPGPVATRRTATTPLNHRLGDPPYFPEVPPTSMQETVQRVMALVKEANQLIPLFPAIESHLQKAQKIPIHVYEDTGVFERSKLQSTIPLLDDFEKENVRAVWPVSNTSDDPFDNTVSNLHDQSDEESIHGSEARQQSEDIDHPRGRSSASLMPPPHPPDLSPTLPSSIGSTRSPSQQLLSSSQMIHQRMRDPPSTGTTPVHTQNDEVLPRGGFRSLKVLANYHDDSEAFEVDSSQIGTQFVTQVTLPLSDDDGQE
ncbi:dead deah box helicase [Diplodia corticola]|uniref:Dead deah box helicase n=1 Tax=Diplodia corticola TaxID=236234 RepID=A0A1J9R5Q9_9PEZI|nr:dead deah box helicase [Diplodia corticola]OJD35554.1 dead deah box helicase [Diplodia corticola]